MLTKDDIIQALRKKLKILKDAYKHEREDKRRISSQLAESTRLFDAQMIKLREKVYFFMIIVILKAKSKEEIIVKLQNENNQLYDKIAKYANSTQPVKSMGVLRRLILAYRSLTQLQKVRVRRSPNPVGEMDQLSI